MPNDIQTTAQDFARVLLELFAQPQLIRGCLVKSVADKDEYTTNNGWIQAICGEHNQQPVRYFGQPAGLVVDTTYIDVLYFPSTKGFMVYGPGGTSDAGGAKVAQVWESDFGAVALQSDASGNIGIGTASPDGPLHVMAASAGTVSPVAGANDLTVESGDSSGVGVSILSPDAYNNQIVFGSPSDNDFARILTNYNSGAPFMAFYVNGGERARIIDNGNVGFGTSTPGSDRVAFQGPSGANLAVGFYPGDGDGGDFTSLVIYGVGTPGSITNRERLIFQYNPSSGATAPNFRLQSEQGGTGTLRPIVFETEGNSEQLLIATSGYIGLSVASPQGILHTYNSISGFLLWEYNDLDATVRAIVPNGSGDCLYRLHAEYVLRDSAGAVASGSTDVSNSASANLTVGSNTVRLRVNADGSIDTSRTAGSDTIKVAYTLRWL